MYNFRGKWRWENFIGKYYTSDVEKRYQSTIGVDYAVYRKNNPSVKLHIWDTSGAKRFDYVVDLFMKNIDVVLFVYKCHSSFTYLIKKLKEVKKREQLGNVFALSALVNHT